LPFSIIPELIEEAEDRRQESEVRSHEKEQETGVRIKA
jgi:hypothetical protein